MVGGKLYVYEANTSTPVTTYQTADLTPGQENTWPLVTDANGRLPAVWVPDGNYRVRFTDADDLVQFDDQNVPAIGAQVEPEPPEIVTGFTAWRASEENLTGWVKLNGQTIGIAGSGGDVSGDEYADLYAHFWDNFPDAICGVVGGRGASAEEDFIGGKLLVMPDLRGRMIAGLDDMGSDPADRLLGISFVSGDAVTGGSVADAGVTGSGAGDIVLGTWYIKV